NAARRLNCELQATEPIMVHVFGGQAHFTISQYTTVALGDSEHAPEIEAYVMPPKVIAPIEVPDLATVRLAEEKRVDLPRASNPTEEVDLLIGVSDFNRYLLLTKARCVFLTKT